jgi:hypothetical protein
MSDIEMGHILVVLSHITQVPNLAVKMASLLTRTDFLTCSLIFTTSSINKKYFYDAILCFGPWVLQNKEKSESNCRITVYFRNISTENVYIENRKGQNTDIVFLHISLSKCYILHAVWKPINVSWGGAFICTIKMA